MDQYKLYKGVNLTNTDTIRFTTQANQTSYFNTKLFKAITGREKVITDSIKVTEVDYYDLLDVTYISTNKVVGGKNKTYYYFVNTVEYVNDNLTKLMVELDYVQTYMFDYSILNSSVIRQHERTKLTNGKRVFSKTKEQVDTNEFEYKEIDLFTEYQKDFSDIYAAIITTKLSKHGGAVKDYIYGVLPKGFKTYMVFFRPDKSTYEVGFVKDDETNKYYQFINATQLNHLATNPNVYDIYITPYVPNVKYGGIWSGTGSPYITGFWGYAEGATNDYNLTNKIVVDSGDNDISFTYNLLEINNMEILKDVFIIGDKAADRAFIKNLTNQNDNFDSKVYGAQYSTIELVSGVDERTSLFIDEFNGDIGFSFTLGNDINKMIYNFPLNYNIPNKQAITGAGNSLAMITDAYTEYMNNNKHSINAKNTGNIVKAVAGVGLGVAATVATGGAAAPAAMAIGASVINTGIGQATNFAAQNAELRDLKNRPDKVEVTDDVDFNITNGFIKTRLIVKTPTAAEKARLTKYFKLYGYASTHIGVPNLTNRRVFNYVELSDVVISGGLSKDITNNLKQRYNQGVRFWHSPSTFLNFDIENGEV